ncbi:hypothetical protein ACFFWC_23290 [Plantactinospora siamensis]|uniref:Uncharacterized protein n=1 Tax=Plantactinospora siamensis TaxID=555372 RepID=A0ABV6NUC5_9ACTN
MAMTQFAIGLIARHGRSAVTVGYFFGPALTSIPVSPPPLKPEEALFVARFGDIPLVNDEWRVIGQFPEWDRAQWPSSEFLRGDLSGRGLVVVYDDNDPNLVIDERPANDEQAALPTDDLFGYIILRNRLSEMLI